VLVTFAAFIRTNLRLVFKHGKKHQKDDRGQQYDVHYAARMVGNAAQVTYNCVCPIAHWKVPLCLIRIPQIE